MKTHQLNGYRFNVLSHGRVFGQNYARPAPDRVAEVFEIDVFTQHGNQPVDLYPNANPHPHPDTPNRLTIYWDGKQVQPVNGGGVKRGGDFRTRFWPSVMRRVLKAAAAERLGVTIGRLADSDIDVLPTDLPTFTGQTLNAAGEELAAAATQILSRIPAGTIADIDADFDSTAHSGGSEDETDITLSVSQDFFFVQHRAQFRFPLSSLPTGATINDSDIQFNVTSEDVEGSEGITANSYDTNGGQTDPDTDTAADKYTNSGNGTALVTISCSSTGSKTGDLGTTADSHIATNIDSPDFYSIGFINYLLDNGELIQIEAIENTGTDPATLTVDYTAAAGGGSSPAWTASKGGWW